MSRRFALALTAFALAALTAPVRTARAVDPSCQKWDLEVSCTTNPSRVIVGDPFTATVTVRNAGDSELANVTLQLRGDLGAKPDDPAAGQMVIEKLAPGAVKELSAAFRCLVVGATRVLGGARDAQGWAAANCACTVDIIGLPAIQSEMTDKDVSGAEKGIFQVGEEFLYVLDVQNDVGTTSTPDLKVVFSLPKELDFVSGTGDRGVTITGSGQSATSTGFALASNEVEHLTIRVKATAAPPSNFVQTRASIQTVGGIEVAEESESTTVKEATPAIGSVNPPAPAPQVPPTPQVPPAPQVPPGPQLPPK